MSRPGKPGRKHKRLAVTMGTAVILVAGWCQAARRHVTVGGEDCGDGLTWATALGSVQRALDLSAPGDEVWVAGGRHEASSRREVEGEAVWATSFLLRDGVSLYGGFAGHEQSVAERRQPETAPMPTGAWDFVAETVLTLPDGHVGSVLYGDAESFEHPTVIDGFTITGGHACGRGEDGYGGGGLLPGKVVMTRCRVTGNLARSGGGLALRGGAEVHACAIADNDLLAEGWGGLGGGLRLLGPGAVVANSVITGNGAGGEVRAGGGIYTEGAATIAACTITGNAALRQGSGVSLAGTGGQLLNCLVWGNQGSSQQVSDGDAFISHCGITGGPAGNGNIPLEDDNAGPGGVNSNDNWVDGYYVCFINPDNRDFRLGAGSYAINRGRQPTWNDYGDGDAAGQQRRQQGYDDLGAFESQEPGNLALDFAIDFPCLYRERSTVWPVQGAATPEGISIHFWHQTGMASWRQDERAGEDDLWSVEWLATGPATPCLEAAMTGPAAEYWRTFTLSRTLTVKPRPLVVAADDLEYTYGDDFPALTWSIVGGRLADGDAVTGNLTCAYAGVLDQTYAITPGTLRVEDGAGGANYRMEFWPGILICHKAIAAMTVTGNEHVYNGAPADFTWTTDPPGLAGVITCTGLDGTAYGPAPELPVAAGTYLVTVQVDDPHYRGQVESNLRIHKATLTVSAAPCTRMFGVANPDFQLTYTGFRGSDGPEALAPPLTTCMAEPGSPVGNYAITLSGGQADNYDLQLLPGTLTITPAPVLASVTVAPATYGDRLEDLAASAAAAHAVTGAPVPGTLRWVDAGDTVLAAGEHACDWTFLPDDANHAAVTSTAMVVVAKAPLAVQAPRLERGAGTENPAMTLAYSGFVQDEDEHTPGVFVRAPTLACAASADSPAGLYPIQILPGEAVNYEMTYLDGWLQVCLALPQVDSMIAMEATYGTFLQDIVLTGSFQHPVTGAAVSGTLSWEDGQELPPAGTHVRPWRFVPDDGDRYAPVCGVAEVVVHPRRLVIAAGSDSKNYGEDDPPFTWEFTPSSMPLVDGDAIDVHVRRTAGEMPGQYELWPEIAAPDGNYTVELLPGTLTIRRLPIAVWADSRFKPFGEPDPALTYKVTQGALLEGDAFSGSLEREAGEERGSYAIHQGTLSLPEYYLITFKSSQLSILTRQLTVSFTPWSKVYGEPDPDWNCSITVGSLLPGDALAGSPGRHPGEAVGQYAVHAGDLRVNDNYTLSFRPGAVAILPRAITVQAHDLWRFPRMPNPPLTYEITEGAIVDGTSFTGELSCPQTTLLGTHEIKQGTLALNDNYVLTYRPGVLDVVSPVITNWEAAATELTYGQKLADAGLAGAFLHPRTGEPVPGTLQWELPETMPNPGVRMHAAQFLPEPLTWLDPVKLAVSVTVHRIRLKVVAQSYDIIWGDMIGDGTGFKYEITEGALLPGDTPSGNVSCVNTGHVGVYPISMGSLRFPSHYDVEFVPGTLTIRHRHLTVQADDMSKIMNHTDPVYTYTIIDGSLAGNAFFAGIMMREAGETPGTYRMMLGTFKVSTADCILHFVEGTFTILPTPEPRVVYATSIYVGEPLSCSTLRGVMGFNDTATRGHQAAILTWATPDERLPAGTWSREWLYVDDAGIIDRGMCNVRVIPLRVTVAPRPSTRPIRGAAQDDSAAGSEASGWGVDLFASLEEALAAVAPNGKVLVEPGEYLAPAQGWFIDKNVTITGGQDTPPLNPDPQAPPERQPEPNPQAPPSPEAVLLGEVIIAGEDTTTVTISGLTILAPTGGAAIRIAAANADVCLLENCLGGDQTAVLVEDFASLSLSGNVLSGGQGVSAPDGFDIPPAWREHNEFLAP